MTEPSTTEKVAEELTTAEADIVIPVMVGSSIEYFDSLCRELGLTPDPDKERIASDVYYRHCTGDAGVFSAYYYGKTKEIMGAYLGLVPGSLPPGTWEDIVKKFAVYMCPANSSSSVSDLVSKWIDEKIGKYGAKDEIDGFDYIFANEGALIQFHAGVSQVNEWLAEVSATPT